MKSDVVDIRGQIHAMTDRAILFSDDGDRENAKWLPLSQVEVEKHGLTFTGFQFKACRNQDYIPPKPESE